MVAFSNKLHLLLSPLLDWGNVTVRERAVDLMQAAGARQLSASVLSREKLEQRKRSAIVHELTYLLDDVLYAMNNSNLADVQTVSRDCYWPLTSAIKPLSCGCKARVECSSQQACPVAERRFVTPPRSPPRACCARSPEPWRWPVRYFNRNLNVITNRVLSNAAFNWSALIILAATNASWLSSSGMAPIRAVKSKAGIWIPVPQT